MALVIPPFSWSFGVDNLTGTPPAATPGTSVTAGASNVDGAAVSVLGALAHDVHYLVIGIGGMSLSTADGQCLLDVLSDPAGGTAWGSLIDDLVCGFTGLPTAGTIPISQWYHFPLFVGAGTSIGVRARTSHTVAITTGRVIVYAFGGPSRPDAWWCGSRVESLGINAATSKGTNVTPGNTGVYGSWTTIGTSTARYGAVQMGVNGSDGTSTAIGYYWQLGVGSTKLPGAPTLYSANNTGEAAAKSGFVVPVWCDVPASTAWQIRATASGTAEIHNCAVYGVY